MQGNITTPINRNESERRLEVVSELRVKINETIGMNASRIPPENITRARQGRRKIHTEVFADTLAPFSRRTLATVRASHSAA
jgi:hypothetical protein